MLERKWTWTPKHIYLICRARVEHQLKYQITTNAWRSCLHNALALNEIHILATIYFIIIVTLYCCCCCWFCFCCAICEHRFLCEQHWTFRILFLRHKEIMLIQLIALCTDLFFLSHKKRREEKPYNYITVTLFSTEAIQSILFRCLIRMSFLYTFCLI